MAWSTPGTWSDGTKVTGTFMNQQVRDNLLALDQHGHSGAAGDGASTLGDLVTVTFIDAAAPAAPGGTLTRVFSTGTQLGWRSGAAGTVNLVATGSHEHTSTSVQAITIHNQAATNTGQNITIEHATATATISTALALGGSGKRVVSVVGGATVLFTTGSFRLIAKRDSTEIGTVNSGALSTDGTGQSRVFLVSVLDVAVASGTYTYSIEFTGSVDNPRLMSKFLNVREIRVL